MKKVSRIIEYQEKQRTPMEVINYLRDEVEAGNCTHIIAIYHNEDTSAYIIGNDSRDYMKSQVLWDAEHWKRWWLAEV